MKYVITFLTLFFVLVFASAQTHTVYYDESFEDFPNPERGFYRYSSTYANPYNKLSEGIIRPYRSLHKPSSAAYKIYSTLIYRYFFLDAFTESPISQEYLDNMAEDFEVLRKSGMKIILRMAYTQTVNDEGCTSWICPPYGDASKAWVLEHISQLKPVFHANKDVIAVVQLGFIGVWGEGYYTDYFGDASQPPYILTEENWNDRSEVLTSLLDAVPVERQIQVRYPQVKQKNVYGSLATTDSPALKEEEAHNGSAIARIGHHNDCFLASSTDFGTYQDYGPPSSSSDTAVLKSYYARDTRFVAVGGETCSSYNPYDDCESAGGRADKEMRRFHYSYLNSQYNNSAVNNDWVGQGCIEEIKRNLGYRFVLSQGTYSTSAKQGDKLYFTFELKNVGYAAPFNPRDVELILRDAEQQISYRVKLNEDPRFWEGGEVVFVTAEPCLPKDIQPGKYELYLNMPDPEPTLHDNKEYSIRIANENVWQEETGYNKLFNIVYVEADPNAVDCEDNEVFEQIDFFVQHNEVPPSKSFEIYPNPAQDILNIEAGKPFAFGSKYAIYTSYGKLFQNGALPVGELSTALDINSLPEGIYVISLLEGNSQHTERLVIF